MYNVSTNMSLPYTHSTTQMIMPQIGAHEKVFPVFTTTNAYYELMVGEPRMRHTFRRSFSITRSLLIAWLYFGAKRRRISRRSFPEKTFQTTESELLGKTSSKPHLAIENKGKQKITRIPINARIRIHLQKRPCPKYLGVANQRPCAP